MKRVGVVTTARSDYSVYLPVLRAIEREPSLELHLIAAGMHLAPEFGLTVKAIENDGFDVQDRVEMLLSSDTPCGTAKSMGLGTIGFAQAFERSRPDLLLVLGDRFEMHSAVVAAVPFALPIAHIAGGARSEGAIDEAFRHSITKMSHLHFAELQAYANRIIQMGEEPWRVTVCGAPALDGIRAVELLSLEQINKQYGLQLDQSPLLVTFHPVTLEGEHTGAHIGELLEALAGHQEPIVFTYPNADPGGRIIIGAIEAFVENHPRAWAVANLSTMGYLSLMKRSAAMVGNSSSGIVEAPSFELPVVNVGHRQDGRIRARNVIDVACRRDEIQAGIARALDPEFRRTLTNLENPYGDGHAAERIVDVLRTCEVNERLLVKHFWDIERQA